MKHFIYKTLFFAVVIVFTYHLTLGYSVRSVKIDLINYFDKSKINLFKEKLKTEMQNSLDKEYILSSEDAKLISDFINKIIKELNYK